MLSSLLRRIRTPVAVLLVLLLSLGPVEPVSAVLTFQFDGEFGNSGGNGQLAGPNGLDINQATGDVFVANSQNNTIEVFNDAGTYLISIGSFGSGPGQFNNPTDVTVDPDGLFFYVADSGNDRISKHFIDGTFSQYIGSAAQGDGDLSGPHSVAINPTDGNLWVSNTGRGTIEVFDPFGTHLNSFGAGMIFSPSGGAFDGNGSFWLTEFSGPVKQYDATNFNLLNTIGEFPTLQGAASLAFDRDGNVIVPDLGSGDIKQLDPVTGNVLATFGSQGSGPGQFSAPFDVAINPNNGDVLVVDGSSNKVAKFNTDPNLEKDTFMLLEDETRFLDVLNNDATDVDPSTLAIGTPPSKGSAIISDGQILYVPDADENGTDVFTYTASDHGPLPGLPGEVTVNITPVNDAPFISANNPPSVFRGGERTLSPLDLGATDPDNTDQEIVFTFTATTTHGDLFNLDNPNDPLGLNDFFTKQDINDGKIVYRNNGDSATEDLFIGDVSDGTADPVTFFFEFDIIAPVPPTTGNDSFTTVEDVLFDIDILNLLSNATEGTFPLDGVNIASQPTSNAGSVSIVGNNVRYTPATDFFGQATFTYHAVDDRGNPSDQPGTVTIDVTPVNDPPFMVASAFEDLANGGTATITSSHFQVGDPDNNNNDFDFHFQTQPDHGTVARDGVPLGPGDTFTLLQIEEERVRYTHDGSNTTQDQFTFDVSDGTNLTPAQLFNISILPNQPPIANNDAGTVAEDGTLTLEVLANDSDPDGSLNPGSVTIISPPAHGTATTEFDILAETRNLTTYTPEADFNGIDTFTYTVTDNNGAVSDPATVTITIDPVNDPPTQAGTNSLSNVEPGSENTITNTELNADDVDDNNADLQYQITSLPTNGTLTLNQLLLTLNDIFTQGDVDANNLRYINNGNGQTTDQWTYDLTDGSATVSNQTVSTTVKQVVPPTAGNHKITIDEDDPFDIALDALITENSQGTFPIAKGFADIGPSNETLNFIQTQGGAGDEDNFDVFNIDLQENFNGESIFTYKLQDIKGNESNEGTITVCVNPVNDPPTQAGTNNVPDVDPGSEVIITNTSLNATDLETLDELLQYQITSLPSNGDLKINGLLQTLNDIFTQGDVDANNLRYINNGNGQTTDQWTYDLTDGSATLSNQTVSTTVKQVVPPTAGNHKITVEEDEPFDIALDALITQNSQGTFPIAKGFADIGPSDEISSFIQTQGGAGDEDNFDVFNVELQENFNGESIFTYKLQDIKGNESNEGTITVCVNPVNDPPTQTGTNSVSDVESGSDVIITNTSLNATDVDNDDASLEYTITSLPPSGSLTLNGVLQTLNDIFTQGDVDANNLRYINDGNGATTDQWTYNLSDGSATLFNIPFNLNINGVNKPIAKDDLKFNATEDQMLEIPAADILVHATAGSFPPTSIFLVDFVGNGIDNAEVVTFDPLNGDPVSQFLRVTFKPNFTGEVSLTYIVQDDKGNSSENPGTIRICVDPVNDAPAQAGTNTLSDVEPGEDLIITNNALSASDLETLDELLEYQITSLPANGSLTSNGVLQTLNDIFTQGDVDAGNVRYINNGNGATTDQWTYNLSDGTATLSNLLFSIQLIPVVPLEAKEDIKLFFQEDERAVLFGKDQLKQNNQGTFPLDLFNFSTNPAVGPGIASAKLQGGGPQSGQSYDIEFEENFTGETSISFIAHDINGNPSEPIDITICVTPVNDVPQLTFDFQPFNYEEDSGPIKLPGGIELKDDDGDVQMVSATIKITGNYRLGEDVLNLPNPPAGMTVSFDVATGTLMLTGAASIETYQAAIREVTYENTFNNPNEDKRTLTITVDDGVANSQAPISRVPSNALDLEINIIAVNDAPTIAANNPLTVDHNASDVITAAFLQTDDPDHDPDARTYTITTSPEHGDLRLNGTPVGQNGAFTQADIDAGLLAYRHNGNLTVADAFTFDVSDGEDAIVGQTFAVVINEPVFIPGDLNGDDRVNIQDAVRLVAFLLNKVTPPERETVDFLRADMSRDDDLSVVDVIAIIRTILGLDPLPAAKPVAMAPVAVGLAAAEAGEDQQLIVPLVLDAAGPVAGFQAEISFEPSRMTLGEPQLGVRAEGLTVDTFLDGDILRVLVYGAGGQTITPGTEAVLHLPVTLLDENGAFPAEVRLENVLLAGPQAQVLPMTMTQTAVAVRALPAAFALRHARPNPFNPTTTIAYDVPEQAHVTLIVYNLLGQEVVRLVDQVQAPGRYELTWNARNAQGRGVSSGIYLYRLASSTGFAEAKRMTLVK